MKKFDYEEFYECIPEETYRVTDERFNVNVKLKAPGQALIAQYYNDKYKANIICESDASFKRLAAIITEARRNETDDFRMGICLSIFKPITGHTTPIVYVKEGKDEGLIISDSLGTPPIIAQAIHAMTGLRVYTDFTKRQSDMTSCYTDGVVFCSIGAGKDPKTGQYRIPNILSKLRVKEEKEGYSIINLPDEFLVLFQKSVAMAAQEEKAGRIIHKHKNAEGKENDETLPQHRARYSKALTQESILEIIKKHKDEPDFKVSETINTYLREKGLKFADLIEIQFYIEQLYEELGSVFTITIWEQFVENAKKELSSQGQLDSRPGLHDFAEQFLAKIKKQLSPPGLSEYSLHTEKAAEIKEGVSPEGLEIRKTSVEDTSIAASAHDTVGKSPNPSSLDPSQRG